MQFSFPQLIYQAVNKKLIALSKDQSKSREQSLQHALDLELIKTKLETFKDPITNCFFGYNSYNVYQRTIFRDVAKLICRYCAISIRNRCLELGFDNYDRSIHDLGVIQLMDKLKEFKLELLVEQMARLKKADELKDQMAKSFGFKPHPFSLNQEVVSAIFRADPIIHEECEIMMLTIYSFIQKKAFQFGLKNPIERTGLDYSDFFNVSCIGYLNSTLYWDPKCDHTKSRFSKQKDKKVFSAYFPAYGWTFAMGQITLLIYSRRMVRFPNHLEEAINRIHRTMRKRKLEIMGKEPNLNDYQIDMIIATEMKEDVRTIQNIFSVFVSPNSALTSLLPSEQRILNLNSKHADSELELIDIVQDSKAIDPAISIDHEFMSHDLYKQLQILDTHKRIVLQLRYGLKIKPKEWQDSGFKVSSGIAWKDLTIQVYTLKQIGDMIGLSAERIRAIEAECFRKLRGNNKSKTTLQKHFNGNNHIPNFDSDKISQEAKVYEEQMRKLDLLKFNKICNHNHQVPKSMHEAIQLFDYLKLLKPMTVGTALELLIIKLYQFLNTTKRFSYPKVIPSQLWNDLNYSSNNSRYFDLTKQATFKEIEYHFAQIANYPSQASILTSLQQNDLSYVYKFLNNNPIFLIHLL
jgi:RNA polymerase sigma factor (sigma-70 family)